MNGTWEVNKEFRIAFNMVQKLSQKRWEYYYQKRLGQSPSDEGKMAIKYYQDIQDEINVELGIKKPVVIVEKEEDDFQF